MKEQVFVSVVLYAYNNERDVETALVQIDNTMMNYFKNYELILVNDFSSDGTLENMHNVIKIYMAILLSLICRESMVWNML